MSNPLALANLKQVVQVVSKFGDVPKYQTMLYLFAHMARIVSRMSAYTEAETAALLAHVNCICRTRVVYVQWQDRKTSGRVRGITKLIECMVDICAAFPINIRRGKDSDYHTRARKIINSVLRGTMVHIAAECSRFAADIDKYAKTAA